MDRFYSIADMLNQYVQKGWTQTDTPRGFSLYPPSEIASGYINVWGTPDTHCFIESDVTFHVDLMERYYYTERGFQITFIENMTLTYYQSKTETQGARFGVYCYVNNRPQPWYKRFPAGATQKVSTIAITETFLAKAGLSLSNEAWDRAAMNINNGEISLPSLAQVCQDIQYASVIDECFPFYFHAKSVEAIALLLDYALDRNNRKPSSLSSKSISIAKEALQALNRSYANPPVIETLARSVGIDKKTLQSAIQHMTGQTVNGYIRSLRMEKALSLLTEGTMRIDEIAKAVGYHSKINFYKAFADTFACTPNEMRKG